MSFFLTLYELLGGFSYLSSLRFVDSLSCLGEALGLSRSAEIGESAPDLPDFAAELLAVVFACGQSVLKPVLLSPTGELVPECLRRFGPFLSHRRAVGLCLGISELIENPMSLILKSLKVT